MKDPQKREALYRNEASRILMDTQPPPEYPISPELQKWRESTFKKGDAYLDNDQAFRETVIARLLTGDPGPDANNPMPMESQVLQISSAYEKMLNDRDNQEQKQKFDRTFRKPIMGQNRGIMRSSTRQIK
jgi:hypothetical protein